MGKGLLGTSISRRSFAAGAAAVMAGLVATGCSTENKVKKIDPEDRTPNVQPDEAALEWKTAACWQNCGGRCLNRVAISEGVVVRSGTDDLKEDTLEAPQQRACPRGRARQQEIMSETRIKYPMKRTHWEPENGGDKSLRGFDTWERLSWDDAIQLVCGEIQRVYGTYGPRGVLWFDNPLGGTISNVLCFMGGYVKIQSSDSYGTWRASSVNLGTGLSALNIPDLDNCNDRLDLKNAETIVFYGMNPAWASAGNPSYFYMQAKKAGVSFVFVGPSANATVQLYDAKWIRVRPGTDTAFLLAVAYQMIKNDEAEPGSVIDWDFLNRCTVGFDMEHLPADATVQECFKGYVLGEYDGVPKTPEWATEICGTPVEDIEWYAEAIGCQHKVMLLHSYAAGRCNGAEDLPQLFMTVGAMGGHMGKSGHCCGAAYHFETANSGPRLVSFGTGMNANPMGYFNPVDDTIGCAQLGQALETGKFWHSAATWSRGMVDDLPGEERALDVHLMVSQSANFMQTRPDTTAMIRGLANVDTFVTVAYNFNLTAQYSDIVLPVVTPWENNFAPCSQMAASWVNREVIIWPNKIIDPWFESKTDYEIAALLADGLGIGREKVFTATMEQALLNVLVSSTVLNEDGVTPEKLVTITQEDLDWFNETIGAATCELQQGRIGLKEFYEAGIYRVERKEGDNFGYIGYEAFRNDPEANPRPSASGKLEIYCQAKANGMNNTGLMPEVYKPYATYHRPVSGYEDSFSDWEKKEKGEYPYQLYQPHYLRRSHTVLDDSPWLREAWINPVYLSAEDAKAKGIVDGDTVLLFNQFGKILRQACVLETIMPGCIALPHGSWCDFSAGDGIDRGGNENVLVGDVHQPHPILGGYNTTLVDFEKYADEALPRDCDKAPYAPKMAE